MIGLPRAHWRLTDSTNERARELAARGAPHGTLVTADEQSAGRGRQGRTWTAPPRTAILMSLLLRDLDARQAVLPLAAAVAVCEACEEEARVSCELKWPNDVWIDRRKVAGILVEGRPQEGWVVLGIGVNVDIPEDDFPPELRETATSLLIADGARPLEELLGVLVDALGRWLEAPAEDVLSAWRERDALKGQPIGWGEDGSGVAAGIDDTGALLVDTDSGRVTLDAGEVHLVRS
jgi:BirA family transcriptional regulator, biotin operon repressor / biotin---[acetyl-CoA-carboxylase] ligase